MSEDFGKLFARRDATVGGNFEIKKDNALLDNRGNGNLIKNLKVFETPEGIIVYAATDRGIGQTENHDRVVINASVSQFAVLDGMNSAGASQVLASKILAHPDNLEKSLNEADSELKMRRVPEETCLISAKLTPEKILKITQIGDCGAMVFDTEGKHKFSATHEIKMRVQTLPVDMKEIGIKRNSQKLVSTSSVSFFSAYYSEKPYHYDDIQLVEGDTILLFSDALWCNFSEAEISTMIKQNSNSQDLFKKISETLMRKMLVKKSLLPARKDDVFNLKERAQCYFGGDYFPQNDNQSLIIFKA